MSGLISVGVILLIFAVGFVLELRGLWPDRTPAALSFVVVKAAAPCLALTSITERFSRELLHDSPVLLLISLLHILAQFVLAKALSRALRLQAGRKTIFEVTFAFSNVIFIGLPINQIVFGDAGVPFLFAYYIVILAAFWSFGVAQISAAAPVRTGNGSAAPKAGAPTKPARRGVSLANIFNPGFIGVVAGAALVQAGIKLPVVLDLALGYLADLTVPLSLLVIGANLTAFAKGFPRIAADEITILIGKFLLSPLIMIGLLYAFGVKGLPFWVFLLSSTMPCHMQTSILANDYEVEPAYASRLVGLSTLISVVTIPACVALIHLFWS
ncbi:MAG: AEC family transporter [Clostridiales Family XIII bacterium]|jgi:predicted permease|nr:AEC family transporter [Clostridiales Family XIII bacterium]